MAQTVTVKKLHAATYNERTQIFEAIFDTEEGTFALSFTTATLRSALSDLAAILQRFQPTPEEVMAGQVVRAGSQLDSSGKVAILNFQMRNGVEHRLQLSIQDADHFAGKIRGLANRGKRVTH